MRLAALVAIFVVVPLAELYLILKVGDSIGVVWTLALLVADSVLGSALLRSQGRTVWRRFNEALASGRMPHGEVEHGVAVIFGGAFLITPGFITDVIGLALLVPPSRALIVRLARRAVARRIADRVADRGAHAHDQARGHDRGYDVEGTASEPPPVSTRRFER